MPQCLLSIDTLDGRGEYTLEVPGVDVQAQYTTFIIGQEKPDESVGEASIELPRDRQNTVDWGIDCMVVTRLHENQHRLNYTQWWGPAMQRYRNDLDWDADQVPNSVEEQLPGCDPHNNSSRCATIPEHLKGRVPDNDYNTYSASWGAWQPHKSANEDWACPGQQIEKGSCPDH